MEHLQISGDDGVRCQGHNPSNKPTYSTVQYAKYLESKCYYSRCETKNKVNSDTINMMNGTGNFNSNDVDDVSSRQINKIKLRN
ncbi:hypothetical protein OXYTRIMIC_643 [Oxytricha trifallax]|uniref:Uncharacterized protein n=1 Tax=Oxytricha trifallax TaxID=1172189 RepID=A0A073HYN3_9SPIT|nr:hypothetical protein OXYTRIMIC_643 [Oxytricha trifallax]